ncbi:MAG: hypothetical protein AAGG48_14145 [Planctomycetota bacterium]
MKNLKKLISERITDRAKRYQDPLFYDWSQAYRSRLVSFKDKHKGEDCFIVGNGPSLNKMDLSVLSGRHLFGMNKIHLIFERVRLDLSYHVSVNPLVIEQSRQDFQGLGCPSFLSINNWPADEPYDDDFYYLYTNGSPFCFRKTILDRIHEGWTVTFVAMQLAYFMGFQRLFLIGVDHNFKVDGDPNEKQVLEGDDVNHFAPNYFGGKEWHLPDLEASETAYQLARFHYSRAGRQIFDATVDGKLTVFPKVPFADAVKECRLRA